MTTLKKLVPFVLIAAGTLLACTHKTIARITDECLDHVAQYLLRFSPNQSVLLISLILSLLGWVVAGTWIAGSLAYDRLTEKNRP